MRDSNLFDQAVARYFEPIARNLNLPLNKVADGIYEIPSPYFILRVRLDTGHARGLNVMMRLSSVPEFSDDNYTPGIMYGIGCFIEHMGKSSRDFFIEVDSDERFLYQTKLLADATIQFLIPYLLGKKSDFQQIKEAWDAKTEQATEELKQLKFPSFVQKRWHLPPHNTSS